MNKWLARIQAALRALAKFIKLGWRVVTEVHTITWLIIEIFGVTLPPIAFMIWADFRGLLSPPFIVATVLILFAILTLARLAYLGYRNEAPERGGSGAPGGGPSAI
jgi:hypothetical protein